MFGGSEKTSTVIRELNITGNYSTRETLIILWIRFLKAPDCAPATLVDMDLLGTAWSRETASCA